MLTKMAAVICLIYLINNYYKRPPMYHRLTNSTRGRHRRLPKALRDFNPEEDVNFYLFTKFNPEEKHRIFPEKLTSLFISQFDFTKDTKILIHGWKNTENSTFCQLIKNAYLTYMDVNVIVVDWHKLSRHPYNRSCKYMDLVAARVAVFYDFLRQFVPCDTVHIIGHSLGAHVAGIAGELVKTCKVYRITGLDPAGPLFSRMMTDGRLDKMDAQFVDIIHTSGFALGFYSPLGHADFYPNKGVPIQPGCGVDVLGKCSHRRSYHLFEESISTESKFMALNCVNWKQFKEQSCPTEWHVMGEHIQYGIEGKFYLRTSDASPFSLGYQINYTSHKNRELNTTRKKFMNIFYRERNKTN